MKYADEEEKIKTLIVEKHIFKGVENYFTDSLLHQDSLEVARNSLLEDPDSGNEADVELNQKKNVSGS